MPTFTTKDYKAALRNRSARTTSAGGFSVKNDNSFIVIFVIAMMTFIFFYGVSAGLDLDEIFLGNGRGRGGGGILGLLIAGVAWYHGRDCNDRLADIKFKPPAESLNLKDEILA